MQTMHVCLHKIIPHPPTSFIIGGFEGAGISPNPLLPRIDTVNGTFSNSVDPDEVLQGAFWCPSFVIVHLIKSLIELGRKFGAIHD